MSQSNNYTVGNLLDYLYHEKYYKLIDIGLSRQANTSIPPKLNFIGKLEEDNDVTRLFNGEKQQKLL